MPPTPTSDSLPAWQVISQRPDFGTGPAGQPVQGYTITVQIPASGSTFTVFAPDNQYSVERVRALIEAKAAQAAGIDGLSG